MAIQLSYSVVPPGRYMKRGPLHRVLFIVFGLSMLLPLPLAGQTSGLPARAPGYDHYYHQEQPASAFAMRWGYRDGYEDGRRDQTLGKATPAAEQDRYKVVPDHGTHPDIPRAKYKTLYRQAYLSGYEYATKSGSE